MISGSCGQAGDGRKEGEAVEPWREVNRSAASVAADAAADEAALEAVRREFAGRWDILEVFGGYLAVPDGTPVVQAMTLGGLEGKLNRQAEEE